MILEILYQFLVTVLIFLVVSTAFILAVLLYDINSSNRYTVVIFTAITISYTTMAVYLLHHFGYV